MNGNLGINLSLPPGTSSILEQRRREMLLKGNQNDSIDNSGSDSGGISVNEEGGDASGTNNDFIDDEDRAIMHFCPPSDGSDANSISSSVENSDSEEGSIGLSGMDDFDTLSLSPPASLPILKLDLEKLCGYQLSSDEESEQITMEIREALLGVPASSSGEKQAGENLQDATSLDFSARSRELFEAGIAVHSTNSEDDANLGQYQATVHYPEFLPLHDGSAEMTLVATKVLWKKILHPHENNVVNKILTMLSRCSRDLVWKYQMMQEIRRISREETRRIKDLRREKELQIWRQETRRNQLDKLYDVRDTFEIRLHTSKEKYDAFVQEREVRVERELRRRAENKTGTGGIAGLDWIRGVTFGFGEDIDDVVNKLMEERRHGLEEGDYHEFAEDEQDEYVSDEAEHDSSSSENSDGNFNALSKENFPKASRALDSMPPPVSSLKDRKQRRAVTSARRMKKKLHSEKEKLIEEELRQKIKQAHEEEELVRQMLISTDEKFMKSIVMNLEKKLEKVDELLDTLQEEEWKDEEEGLLNEPSSHDYKDQEELDENVEASLLHQILAMILGTLPIGGNAPEEHFSFLKAEHQSIIDGWKESFGRLPRINNGEDAEEDQKAAATKEIFGEAWDAENEVEPIEHLETETKRLSMAPIDARQLKPDFAQSSVLDNWEDAEDDLVDFFSISEEKRPILVAPTQAKAIGLRPGGRLK